MALRRRVGTRKNHVINTKDNIMDRLNPFLGNIDELFKTSEGEKREYVHPALKNLGSVSLVLIREVIAPVVFRNSEEEITDIEINFGT